MKLTEAVIELMFELSSIEGDKHSEFLNGDGQILRNNLLKLFRATENPESHDIIIDIMSEAGYPWFGKLALVESENAHAIADMSVENDDRIMSDDELMELLPANGHLH